MEDIKETIEKFMSAWKNGEYKELHQLCTKTYKVGNTSKQLEAILNQNITSFKVGKAEKSTDVVYDVEISVRTKGMRKKAKSKTITARLVKESKPFRPSETGEWGVNPISVLKGIN